MFVGRRLPRDSAEVVMVGRGWLRVVSAELPAQNRHEFAGPAAENMSADEVALG